MNRFKIFIIVLGALFLVACNSDSSNDPVLDNSIDSYNPITTTPLDYLNSLRGYAGLTHYTENSVLATAAMGHTDYQLNENVMGHDQTRTTSRWFTGAKPSDRAKAADYDSWAVSENISYNKDTANELIDDLMTAIYHRMSLLDFDRDEIGFGFKVQPVPDKENDSVWGVLTTKSGLMALEILCTAGETITSGSYYTCPNTNRVSVESYNLALANVRAKSNEFVVWPAPGMIVPPVFYEEDPDPLPECSVSGNPVSVQINPAYLEDYTLLTDSFVLKDSQGQAQPLVRILSNETTQPDPNANNWKTDTKKWFAAFPEQRLEWGETYTAKLDYQYGGVTNTWQWSFSTPNLAQTPYRLETSSVSQTRKNGETFYIYVPPENCAVTKTNYGHNVSFFKGQQTPQVDMVAIDSQTYRVTMPDVDFNEVTLTFTQQQGGQTFTRQMTIILED
ncbi:CAP domain-containing protein [Thiomicrospira microaerophila]|uniref:CAP domain-containing protein n=1 Tax=Thiomicrospira microaerophila TaxID=406020 RepID=UPI0012FDBA27|nr:CAP domain-containing protein [Thiomicrospira microaerophila]